MGRRANEKRTRTNSSKMLEVLNAHGVKSLAEACRAMGRSSNYIHCQIYESGSVTESVAIFLELKYGIKPEEYEVIPEITAPVEEPKAEEVPTTPVTIPLPDYMTDSDKFYGLVFKAAFTASKQAKEPPKRDKLKLCTKCYNKALSTGFIHKIERPIDAQITCDECKTRGFCGFYEVLEV